MGERTDLPGSERATGASMVATVEHYAYCRDAGCTGCLPSDEDLQSMHVLALWGEMLNRCIAQTPQTKTREGAIEAIVEDGDWYRTKAAEIRRERIGDQS